MGTAQAGAHEHHTLRTHTRAHTQHTREHTCSAHTYAQSRVYTVTTRMHTYTHARHTGTRTEHMWVHTCLAHVLGTHTQTHQAHNKPQKAAHSRNIKTTPRSQCKATRNRKQKQSPPKPVFPRNKTKYTSIGNFWLKRNINRNQIISNEDSTRQNR